MQCTLLNIATVKEESFKQIIFLCCCLSNSLDRFTLATKSIFLVAFYFYNKGESMTNFFALQCKRLYDNYAFTYRIFSSSEKLKAQLYSQTLNDFDTIAKKSIATGFHQSEVQFYTRMFKCKLSTHYYSRVKLPA